MGKKISHCHWRIAKVAKELARAAYQELMGSNVLYDAWKKRNPSLARNPKRLEQQFVNHRWGLFIEAARATLVGLLQEHNNPNIDEKAKEEIMEILALDSSLIRGRVNPAQVAGVVKQG